MLAFQKNPDKLEQKALQYEQKGKAKKAMKYRQKAAQLRANGSTGNSALNSGYGTAVPTSSGAYGTSRPLGGNSALGGNTALGKNTAVPAVVGGAVPLATTTQTTVAAPMPIGTTFGSQAAPGMIAPAGGLGQPVAFNNAGWSTRTPAIYEANALKWEQRGNFNKANKNRGKVWRLQNPQYMNATTTPNFYNNGQFLGYNVPYSGGFNSGAATMQNNTQTIVAPAVVEQVVHQTIVQETARPERIVEVQPVIHREIEAPERRIIEQHTYEQVQSTAPASVPLQPIVQETVVPRIIEEIQPIIHRSVPAPFVERVEQHVTEHVVNPTITSKQVIQEGAPGMAAGGPAVAAGGIPANNALPAGRRL